MVRSRVEAQDPRPAGGGAAVALQRLHRARLARAVGPEQGQHLAGVGAEVETVDGHGVSVAHDQPVDLNDGHRGDRSRIPSEPMIDVRLLRSDLDATKAALARKGVEASDVDYVVQLDREAAGVHRSWR